MKPGIANNILLILSMFAWGSLYPISKSAMLAIDPLLMAFLRYFVGLLPLLPLYYIERKKHPIPLSGKEMMEFFLLGQLGITSFALLLFFGINLSSATNGSLLTNTQPIFAVMLAPLLIGEAFSWKRMAGAAIGFTGMLLITSAGSISGLTGSRAFTGNLLLLGASASMTIYNIYLKKGIRKFGGLVPTVLTIASGTIVLFLVVVILKGFSPFLISWSLKNIGVTLYLGIAATSIPYLLFNKALREVDVVSASGFKFLIPVSGMLLSVFILKEIPTLLTYAGTVLILGSIYFVQKSSK